MLALSGPPRTAGLKRQSVMALGMAVAEQRFDNPRELLGERLREKSIYRLLADDGDRMFGDDYFADLYLASPKPSRVINPCPADGEMPRVWVSPSSVLRVLAAQGVMRNRVRVLDSTPVYDAVAK